MSAWRDRAWMAALFAVLLVATVVLLSPAPPGVGGGLPHVDKLQHALLFALLGLLAGRAYPSHARLAVFAALVFYGAAIEIGQGQVGRRPELLDVFADAFGALAVWLVPRRGHAEASSGGPPSSAR